MKTSIQPILAAVLLTIACSGCSGDREAAEREKLRLEAETRAQRDLQRSNDAVNEVSKKLGREPPAMDLGLPPEEPKEKPADESKPSQEAPKP